MEKINNKHLSLQECKDEVAQHAGFDNWDDFYNNSDALFTDTRHDEAAELYASQKREWIKWEDPHNRVVDNHQASEIVLKFDDGSACFFDGNWPSDGIVTHFLIIPSPPKD